MKIHAAPLLPFDTVVIVENGVVAVVGRISQLVWHDDGADENVDIYLPPDEVEFFMAKWFPHDCSMRMN